MTRDQRVEELRKPGVRWWRNGFRDGSLVLTSFGHFVPRSFVNEKKYG